MFVIQTCYSTGFHSLNNAHQRPKFTIPMRLRATLFSQPINCCGRIMASFLKKKKQFKIRDMSYGYNN